MAVTAVSLIYSVALGTVRRIVIPTVDDLELEQSWHLPGVGEARVIVALSALQASHPQNLINAATGRAVIAGVDDRHALIDADGNVRGAHLTDPACVDPPAGHTHRLHPTATLGWYYDGRWHPVVVPTPKHRRGRYYRPV